MPHTPNELFLEITHACPMSCIHCSSFKERETHYQRDAYMPTEKLASVIEDFARMGGRSVVFSGGEPLLHPDLLHLIRCAAAKALDVRLFSSGLLGLLPQEHAEISQDLAVTMKAAGLRRIDFNVQGACPETHERISRTKGSFELVIRSMTNAKSAGLLVGIHFVPMRENYQEFAKVATLARDMNLDGVSVLRFVPQGRGKFYRERLELSPKQFLELLVAIARYRKEPDSISVRTGCPMNFVTFAEEGREVVKCGAAKTTSVVIASGDVVPCAAFKQAKPMVGGNVLDQDFAEIWARSAVFTELRDFRHANAGNGCPECSRLATNEGLCHAQRYAVSGSIYQGHDPHCPSLVLNSEMSVPTNVPEAQP